MEKGYDRILALENARWRRSVWRAAGVAALALAGCGYVGLFDARRLAEGLPSIGTLLAEMTPPDFRGAGRWALPLVDTMTMSMAGTALAVALSLPLALLAARTTAPHPLAYHASRTLLNALRSVPELILGILFVAAVGFGPLPGVLALGLHSVGMVGKFFAEAIEHADPAPVEAVRAAGASPFQVVYHGILPQVLPQLADVTVYRWEYNFRASTVMGAVGAGGIGLELMAALRIMQYRSVAALLLVILLAVMVVDGLGARLRRGFK